MAEVGKSMETNRGEAKAIKRNITRRNMIVIMYDTRL